MPIQRVVIELSSSHLRVAVLRGPSIADSRSARLNVGSFSENWPGVLDAVRPALTAMVDDLDVKGAEATLLYASPTSATGIFACPHGQRGTAAMKAAELALGEAAGFALSSNPHDLTRLVVDQAGSSPQVHTLGIAETEETAQALAEWLTTCGLEPMRIVPVDVPAMAAAVDCAMELSEGGPVALALYAGEHGSVLAAATGGRLRFVRQIALGTESLVEAISREVRAEGANAPAMTLDAEAAARIVFGVGIPRRDQVVDASRGLSGDAILPLIQPTLQRVVVEIKQSLRFGLEEQERQGARLFGIGPGTAVPRLLELIAEQSGLKLESSQAEDGSRGNVGAWVGGKPLSMNLLPRSLSGARQSTRLKRGLWIGVGAGLALTVIDAVTTRMELRQQEKQRTGLKSRLEAARPSTDVQNRLIGAQAGLSAAKELMATRLDGSASWDAAMVMLSKRTPDSIKLSQVHFFVDAGQPMCRISGQAPLAEQGEASLRGYMDALTAMPIVKACKLGATQRGEGTGGIVQHFDMTLGLVDLPASDPSLGAIFGAALGQREGTP